METQIWVNPKTNEIVDPPKSSEEKKAEEKERRIVTLTDLLDRKWTIYWTYEHRNRKSVLNYRAVSVMKIVSLNPYLVAVGRSYSSPLDHYIKKKGRGLAVNRLTGLLENYKDRGITVYPARFNKDNEGLLKFDKNGLYDSEGHRITSKFSFFEVDKPENLLPVEYNFWAAKVQPRLNAFQVKD